MTSPKEEVPTRWGVHEETRGVSCHIGGSPGDGLRRSGVGGVAVGEHDLPLLPAGGVEDRPL